ncbi:Elongator complex protein 4 [Apostasia shenzhenica]|uniref:Elongator complex protein 4 n=1 Tax=Apostasia shenzhenica TaxID=1088818 RepID=A0A2I0B2I6_9ASPA|nr:Elongator complex protein 4 [Apostasia shenzhenica]
MRAGRPSSFCRNQSTVIASAPPLLPGVKPGAGGKAFISSGIRDLDRILGGGFLLGSVVMVMEDAEAPHHLLLLRNFMAQGVVHRQLLFAAPAEEPRTFLGTLPAPVVAFKEDRQRGPRSDHDGQEQSLRIAWQYKKYFGEQQASETYKDAKEFSTDFDLRKSLDRRMLSLQNIDCVSLLKFSTIAPLRELCSSFLSKLTGNDVSVGCAARIAILSLCAPQCRYSDWDMISFVRTLRAMIRSCKAVAVITFPSSVLSPSFLKRWQHLADTLLSVRSVADDDENLAKLLTGYQDMVGLLHVHKVAQVNTQVPVILEANTFSLKLHRRRSLVLERLNQAPVDGSSGTSYGTSGPCSASTKSSSIDF